MSKRILVVEDQEDNRQIIRDMLVGTDYEMIEAENGEEALEAVGKRQSRPDLDGYPDCRSWTATRRRAASRPIRRCKCIPIIAVTSYALSGDDRKACELAAMIMCQSPTAHGSCWQRSGNISPRIAAVHFGRKWHLATNQARLLFGRYRG